jgi:hypothetical protein
VCLLKLLLGSVLDPNSIHCQIYSQLARVSCSNYDRELFCNAALERFWQIDAKIEKPFIFVLTSFITLGVNI